MSILGLDFGEKYVGVAVSDPENRMAFGRPTIVYQAEKELLRELGAILHADQIQQIVIGLPLALSGRDSRETQRVRKFAKYVKIKLNLPVTFVDERLSSRQASKLGARDVHQESARLLLQLYLDQHKNAQ